MKNLVVTEEVWKEGTMYTAYCPELDFVSCGKSVEEARNNLVEVIEIQLEEMARFGTLKTFLEDAGYDLDTSQLMLTDWVEIHNYSCVRESVGVLG